MTVLTYEQVNNLYETLDASLCVDNNKDIVVEDRRLFCAHAVDIMDALDSYRELLSQRDEAWHELADAERAAALAKLAKARKALTEIYESGHDPRCSALGLLPGASLAGVFKPKACDCTRRIARSALEETKG